MSKRKPFVIDGVADIRDAVDLHGLACLTPRSPKCNRCGCVFFAWCPRASTTLSPDLAWILRADARRRKLARDKARRAGR